MREALELSLLGKLGIAAATGGQDGVCHLQLRLASHIPQAALSNFPMACHPIACARPRMFSFLSISQTSSHAPSWAPCQLIMPWHVRPTYQACSDSVVWSSIMMLHHQDLSTYATFQADCRRCRDCNQDPPSAPGSQRSRIAANIVP